MATAAAAIVPSQLVIVKKCRFPRLPIRDEIVAWRVFVVRGAGIAALKPRRTLPRGAETPAYHCGRRSYFKNVSSSSPRGVWLPPRSVTRGRLLSEGAADWTALFDESRRSPGAEAVARVLVVSDTLVVATYMLEVHFKPAAFIFLSSQVSFSAAVKGADCIRI